MAARAGAAGAGAAGAGAAEAAGGRACCWRWGQARAQAGRQATRARRVRLGVGSARWIEGHACRRRVRRGLVRRRGRAPAAGERGQERLRKFAGAKLQHSTVVQAPRMVFFLSTSREAQS